MAKAKPRLKTKTKAKPSVRALNRAQARKRGASPAAKTKTPARAASKPKPRPKQQFVASHLHEDDFKRGLRRYAHYRDLGMADATGGMVQAHVIRFVPPCRPEEVSKLHYHEVEFQMVYVLKGWIKTEFDGQGAVVMRTGSAWIQPPRIEHKVLDYSDDCEVLEIVLPADFKTVELEQLAMPER
jgi:mannose-6-phosphate isomerase-like protein (cupin superfamily)